MDRRLDADGSATGAPRVSTARRLAFFFLASVTVLCTAEAFWRVVVPVSESERQTAQFLTTSLGFLVPCAVREDGTGGPFVVGQRASNTGGDFRIPLAKTPGVRRIAFVGESTSVQLAGMAMNLLADSPDASAWQLLNCAESGSTLEHVARRTDEVFSYAPDVVVVMFGHNWRMPVMPLDERAIRLRLTLMKSRLVAGLAAALEPPWSPKPHDPAERLASLEAYLRKATRAGREKGIAVVFATATSNLWFPPVIEETALADPAYLEALLDWTRGRGDEAIAGLGRLAAERPHPYWDFLLGTWLTRRGDALGAAERLRRAVDGEVSETDRATTEVNDIIRRVASKENVPLRDSEREMARIAQGGAPGWDVMRDQCHLQPRYVADEARALLELAADATGGARPRFGRNPFADDDIVGWMLDGLATIQSQVRDARARRIQRALSYFVERIARGAPVDTAKHIKAFLDGTVFGPLPANERAAVLVSIADGLEWAGLHENALTLNAFAHAAQRSAVDEARVDAPLGDDPGSTVVEFPEMLYQHVEEVTAWLQLGLLRVADGDAKGAAEAFRRAHAIEPPRADAAFLAKQAEALAR